MFNFKNRRLILSVVLIVLLFLLSSFIPTLRMPLLNVFRFPLTLLTIIKNEIGGMVFYHRNMVNNDRLKDELDFLRSKLNDSAEISQENTRLSGLLNLKKNTPYKVIAARVIGRDPSNWFSAVIIDKGKDAGIKKDFACVSFLGLVGRVVEIGRLTSKVMLLNDPNLSVSAITQRSRQEGLVCGSLGGTLVMKYLTRDSDIALGDTVVSSGLTEIYPKGLLIGTVIGIGQEFSSLSRYAVIKPSVDLKSLEEVLVIIP